MTPAGGPGQELPEAAPRPPAVPRSPLLLAWDAAVGRALGAFLAVAVLGEAAAFGLRLATGTPRSLATAAQVGGLYVFWSHHVGIRLRASSIEVGDALAVGSGSVTVGVAFLLLSALAAFLLFRAGRSVGERAGGSPAARALHGLKVAPPYALASLLLALPMSFTAAFPDPLSGTITVEPVLGEALVWPLLFAAVAGAVGGLWSARAELEASEAGGRRLVAALGGGWRMFLYGLGLALVGLLVLAGVKPDATRGYFRAVGQTGAAKGVALVGHHVLALPNQSMWVLVPSMGACDRFEQEGRPVDVLCYGSFPRGGEVQDVPGVPGVPGADADGATLADASGRAPAGYFLFLLVPLVAVVLGGRAAARQAVPASRAGGAGAGALAGLVFALLVAAGAVLAGVTVRAVGTAGAGGGFAVGPDPFGGTLAALGWGVLGGALGGLVETRGLPPRARR